MRHIVCYIFLFTMVNTPLCQSTDETVFIWDIKDTLYTRQEWNLAKSVSLTSLCRCVGWANPWSTLKDLVSSGGNIRTELLQILCNETGREFVSHYDDAPLPQVMGKWLTGAYTSEEAILQSNNAITQSASGTQYTKALAPCIIPLMFNPSAIVTTFTPNSEIEPILTNIAQKAGCTNSIFANARREMVNELEKTQSGNILAHFNNGSIFTSHDWGILKPQPETIEYIADQYDTAVENCIVIESEQHHHNHLQQHELRSIHYKDPEQVGGEIAAILQDISARSEKTIKHDM